jgi:hypothetical protein
VTEAVGLAPEAGSLPAPEVIARGGENRSLAQDRTGSETSSSGHSDSTEVGADGIDGVDGAGGAGGAGVAAGGAGRGGQVGSSTGRAPAPG